VVFEEKVLYVQKAQQERDRGGCGRRGRGESSQLRQLSLIFGGQGRSQEDRRKLNVDCYNYGKHIHYARDCWAEKKIEDKTNYAEVVEGKLVDDTNSFDLKV
jgi:hypothetical protein